MRFEQGDNLTSRPIQFLNNLGHDVRFALRSFQRNPHFTFAAVLSIAIGIGANVSVLSFVHEFLIDPLPFGDASRIVNINCSAPTLGIERHYMNFTELDYFRQHSQTLETVTAHELTDVTVIGGDEPERLWALRASTNFFETLGITPLHGRTFLPEDGVAGAPGTVVIGYAFWQRLFGGDPDLLGSTIRLDEEAFTVTGIMPAGVTYPFDAQIWMPFREDRMSEVVRGRVRLMGRMEEGASVTGVRDELDALFVQLAELYPEESTDKLATVNTLRAGLLNDTRQAVVIFYAIVSIVLLLVCANVANLLLARGSTRHREIAVRSSLGAGRGRIVSQLFTESILLAVAGGAMGLLLGIWGRDLFLSGSNMTWPAYFEFGIDLTLVLILVGITLLTALIFGLLPALVSTRPDLAPLLHGTSGRSTARRGRIWHQGLLVSLEVGLATMILITGGLMLKSFIGIQRVELGFDPENVVHLEINLASLGEMSGEERVRYFSDLINRIEQHPQVVSAAAGNPLPYIGWAQSYEAESSAALEDGVYRTAMDGTITPGFINTLGMNLVLGRDFTDLDSGEGSQRVTVISERVAELNWPGENPLGRRLRFVGSGEREYPWMEVIGVVGDTRAGTFQPESGWIWVPQGQWPAYELIVAARTRGEPQTMVADIKQMVWEDNPELAMQWSGMLTDTVRNRWYADSSLYSVLLGVFSVLALIMACVGVYGVISYTVVRRSREFGIRLSIGARPADVLQHVLLQGGRLIIFGIAGGLAGAFVLTRLAESMFFGVNPHDPVIYLFCTLLLAGIAGLAILFPAWRAARIDPVEALRVE